MQVVAVGASSASSARNPCRPAACLHSGLQSTYSRTAVHLRLQLYQLRFISKVMLLSLTKRLPFKHKAFNKHQREGQSVSSLALLLSECIVGLHPSQIFL